MRAYAVNNEALVQAVYEAILRDGDVVVDVGARHGRHSLPMAVKVFPAGKVLVFEPLAACRESIAQELIEYRSELASIVKVHSCALGAFSGKIDLAVSRDAFAYRESGWRNFQGPPELKYQPVDVKRLD